MWMCILYDSVLYFINASIYTSIYEALRKKKGREPGTPKGEEEGDITEIVDVKKYNKNTNFMDAVYLGAIQVAIKYANWSVPVNLSGVKMQLMTEDEAKKFLVDIVGLTAIDMIMGKRFSVNRLIRRSVSILAGCYERKMILGKPCTCQY